MARLEKIENRNSTAPPRNKSIGSVLRYKKKAESKALELKVYRTLGGLAARRTPRATLLSRFLDIAIKGFSASSGIIYLKDSATGSLVSEAAKECCKDKHLNIAEQTVKTGTPLQKIISDKGKPHRFKENATEHETVLCVPVKLKQNRLGAVMLIITGETPEEARPELRRLNRLVGHFSTVMARAENFSELDHRISQLSALHEVGNLLTSTLDQKLVRHQTIEALIELMRTETGSLLLVDGQTNQLYFDVALGTKGSRLKQTRINMGEGIAGWVAKYDSTVIIPDVMNDSRFLSSFDHKSKFRTRNMICAPVKIRGRVIGVIQAINRTGTSGFTQDDLKIFELFANHVAIALDNARLYAEVRDTFYATSEALAEAIEKRDPYTGGHTKRVLQYSLAIAEELGLDEETVETLKLSAVLHDIGKIGIADSILGKDAPLSEEEISTMQTHPNLGVEIIKHVPQLTDVIPGIHQHHERIDGFGYPDGKKKIPLIARIISVADTFDAITTTRPYRKGLPVDKALRELRANRGKQFDRSVVNAFIRAQKKGEINKKIPKNGIKLAKNRENK